MGDYDGTGETVPFCTCSSLTDKWTYAFGAHVGLRHASRCIPSHFFHPKLRKIDAVLIIVQPITLPLRHAVSAPFVSRHFHDSPACHLCAADALDVDAYGEQVKRQVVARRASPTKAPKYVPTNPNGPAKPVEIELKNPFDALSVKVQEYLDTLEQPSEKGLALKQGKAPEKRERRTYTPSPQRPRPVKKPATEKEVCSVVACGVLCVAVGVWW